MKEGILLISLGSPYYIRMAANLAFSIKQRSNIHITLVSNNHDILEAHDKVNFDAIIDCPKEYYTINGEIKYFKAKTCIYELSPYERTLFLDVDMVALPTRTFDKLFSELNENNLVFACRGSSDINEATEKTSQWADITKIKSKYNINEGKWFQLSSEFIYFTKTEKNKLFFDKAKEFYENPQIEYLNFAGCMADELAFGVASLLTGVYPDKDQFTPIYWAQAEKRIAKAIDPFIIENYYGYSLGHAYNYPNQKAFYNNIMQYYKPGRQFFPAQNKKIFVSNRDRI